VFTGPHESLAPDLTVLLNNDGVVSILRSDTPVQRRPEPVGTHRPEGIFLARGPGLRSGVSLDELSILDVAPLLLSCLDVPVPEDMSGRLPQEAFESGGLPRRCSRVVPVHPVDLEAKANGFSPSIAEYDAAEEALVLRRLSALGYLE